MVNEDKSSENKVDGTLSDVEVVNGIPCYPNGYKLEEKFEVQERVGWDDRFGATYFVTPQKSDRPLELILRLDNIKTQTVNSSQLLVEVALLRKVHKANKHQLFAQIHEQGTFEADTYFWYTTYFKGGPTLQQIRDFLRQNRSSAKMGMGSVGRFARNLFEVEDFIHQAGFVLFGLDASMVTFDAASRRLFLHDLTTIKPQAALKLTTHWAGSLNYTPPLLSESVDRHLMGVTPEMMQDMPRDAIYLLVLEMAMGELPWFRLGSQQVAEVKASLYSGAAAQMLPGVDPLYLNLLPLTNSRDSHQSHRRVDAILAHCDRIAEAGGCTDWDEDFDFERQPTPEELPRFVMERVDDGADAGVVHEAEEVAE